MCYRNHLFIEKHTVLTTYWEYEGAQAKIVVYLSQKRIKNLVNIALYLTWNRNTTEFGVLWVLNRYTTASSCSSEHKQFCGFLALDIFGRFFTLDFCLKLSRLHCIFCEDILWYLNITNLPILHQNVAMVRWNSIFFWMHVINNLWLYVSLYKKKNF
jgi:hypothetical protein